MSLPRNSEAEVAAEMLLTRGNQLEQERTPAATAEAVNCYARAYSLLLELVPEKRSPALARQLGLARMNHANALARTAQSEAVRAALASYTEALKWFAEIPAPVSPADTNMIGAAYMNRGLTAHRLGEPAAIEAALGDFHRALELLQSLPLDDNPWFRINRAAAGMNLANALLSRSSSLQDFLNARSLAQMSIVIVASLETSRLDAAEIGLKSRRAFCDATGQILPRAGALGFSERALATEATDVVEAGLAVARHWRAQGQYNPEVTTRLFHFGAQVYRRHQPHFLAEYIEENLSLAPDLAQPVNGQATLWHQIALDVIVAAQSDLRQSGYYIAGEPDSERRLATAQELQALERSLRAAGDVTSA